MADNINPDHYKSSTSLECIESMEIIFGRREVFDFCLCNAWKYIWRWKNKNGQEDLKKAEWYLNRADKYIVENKLTSSPHQVCMMNRMTTYILEQKGVTNE